MKEMDTLRGAGVLGINRRNSNYILGFNPRKLYPLVDDKLKTKELLEKNGIPIPKMYFAIRDNFELRKFKQIQALDEFVLKPAKGTQGRGILVIRSREGENWIESNGSQMTFTDLKYHVSNILVGLYSLGGNTDEAYVEYLIKTHEIFSKVSYRGVPDVRVIVYKGIPVMSMLRLTTKESRGKANLHQGGVGAGVKMSNGCTFGGVCHDKSVERHPDTNEPIGGIIVPFWDEILDISIKTYKIFGLGYFGIDFVVDQKLGPLVLELNARPGLSVQIANRCGILPRLDFVDSFGEKTEEMSINEKMDITRNHF